MFAIDEQFLFIIESSDFGKPVTAQNHLKFFLIGLQFWETLLSQNHFILVGDWIVIGIAEKEIWKMIQNHILQFSRRDGGRGECWNRSQWYRRWGGTLCGKWTCCLCDYGAHLSSDFYRG